MAKGTPNGGINGTLSNGLIAHWCFNDGNLNDSSGNANNLIANGTVNYATDKDGQVNQAIGANTRLGLNRSVAMENKDIMKQLGMSKSRFSEIRKSMSNKIIPIYEKFR